MVASLGILFSHQASRYEYRTSFLTRLFGSKKIACAVFCCIIAILALFRFNTFYHAVTPQESWPLIDHMVIRTIGQVLTASGVVMATWAIVALNFYGYGFADSFDILMEERVTSFPFNVFNNPMYLGSTLEYVGASLVAASPTGMLLSALIGAMYLIALHFEEPFTAMIYADKANQNIRKEN
ncbi:phosphatidylethanolamine N-methyltransferase [Strongylocentrotus purpuratus]|uniref:Phosphatidylethanolamine N-methyltransferase n=1 Tax=Strongylocentrotus purpuratus TaxID=7668 RepID=A0A7M7TGS0_STRPU|nr:phosphatidylethanolamine N-methyltransferase [Strongylocentrotus purpuratus]